MDKMIVAARPLDMEKLRRLVGDELMKLVEDKPPGEWQEVTCFGCGDACEIGEKQMEAIRTTAVDYRIACMVCVARSGALAKRLGTTMRISNDPEEIRRWTSGA